VPTWRRSRLLNICATSFLAYGWISTKATRISGSMQPTSNSNNAICFTNNNNTSLLYTSCDSWATNSGNGSLSVHKSQIYIVRPSNKSLASISIKNDLHCGQAFGNILCWLVGQQTNIRHLTNQYQPILPTFLSDGFSRLTESRTIFTSSCGDFALFLKKIFIVSTQALLLSYTHTHTEKGKWTQ
jgi:hypothetical protein